MNNTTVLMVPGTASDEVFVRSVFAGPVGRAGGELVAATSVTVAEHFALLDARPGRFVVGGVSLGAHVAVRWAARNPERCLGLLLALPAWTGDPEGAPAALSALASAAAVEAGRAAAGRARAGRSGAGGAEAGGTGAGGAVDAGVEGALRGVTGWLGEELRRAWTRHGDRLVPVLRAAAASAGPTLAELAGVRAPVGIAACADDPVHPLEVAELWGRTAPGAVVRRIGLADLGRDRESLGAAAVAAWAESAAVAGAGFVDRTPS
ncbi:MULTISPECIES: alpha/beta fold hydrolase [Actinosynnema]|uniref:alpha/beta fold hydrolase n=1 Tax=Actinosynnema TaxID=40566 RepID=UPI0020A45F61|nr:alpha/beta hydrolase [Actinosynnema pretiosum]MCP2093292.1 Alpha/beta hydrolase family [Actinosynnema pretiosum]